MQKGNYVMKGKRFVFRALCALLILCLGAGVGAPVAFAVTPEEEAVLATGQRSVNNPGGSFQAPGKAAQILGLYPFWSFHPDTLRAGWLLLLNILQQIFAGSGEAESFQRVFDYAPVIKEGDALPPMSDFVPGDDLPFLPYAAYMILTGMLDMYVALKETPEPDVYRMVLLYVTRAGEEYWLDLGSYYDRAKGVLLSDNGKGILNIGYQYDASQQMLLGAPNGWNRDLGYYNFFDVIAPFMFFYLDTLRFPFTYDGRDFMVWFWKGTYTVSGGGELGVYENPSGWPVHWDPTDADIVMTMQVYQGDELYIDYGPYSTWWAAGIGYAKPFFRQMRANRMRMTGAITFESPEMLQAFWASFQENKNGLITGAADGAVFTFDWRAG